MTTSSARKAVGLLLALLFSAGAAAQTTYKCKDKAGKVTYTSTECSLIGLIPAGEVADRLNTSPAYKPPPQAVKPAESKGRTTWTPPPNPSAAMGAKPAAKGEEEADPNRRCFRVKTATGYATRCNEKPTEDEAAKK